MPKPRGNRPAVADWDIGVAGARSTQRVYDVSLSQRKDGTVVFRDAAGEVILVASLAPGMFIQRRDRKPAASPPGEVAGEGAITLSFERNTVQLPPSLKDATPGQIRVFQDWVRQVSGNPTMTVLPAGAEVAEP